MIETVNARIANFVCNFEEKELSAETRARALRAILDTVGVAIAGAAEQGIRNLEASLEKALAGAPGGRGWTSPWGTGPYRVDDAAMLLGTASHVLDYDDVSMVSVCHPSAPVVAAMMAATGSRFLSTEPDGKAFVAAFCIGTEVSIRIGQAMGFRHYALGFHTTATLGTIGAAMAVARLAGLDAGLTMHAVSIAASMAGGMRANFGTLTKPLHVGLAAANGLRAVQLARAGIDGSAEVFEGTGFLHAFSGGTVDRWPAEIALGRPFALDDPGFGQKRYPCCYMLHKIIEATLALRQEHRITLDQVESARVVLPKGGSAPLNHPYPRSGLNAKFSAPHAVVAALLDGRINLASFVDSAVMRDEVQRRLTDVTVIEEGVASNHGTDLGDGPVSVSLAMQDGSVLAKIVSLSPGSAEDPVTPQQLQEKWIDCLNAGLPQLSRARAGELFDQGMRLNTSDSAHRWFMAFKN